MLVRIEQAFADRENSEERRKQFLSDASHELRTPLASIRGYAELFRLGPAQDPEALQRAMDRIESEATRMGVLVEDLLTLARLDELPEARQERSISTDAWRARRRRARAMAPTARSRCTPTSGSTVARRAQHAAAGARQPDRQRACSTLRTRVRCSWSSNADGRDAVVEVRDHGPGLLRDRRAACSSGSGAADSGHSRGRDGSGLGLAIVREIVDSHHGNGESPPTIRTAARCSRCGCRWRRRYTSPGPGSASRRVGIPVA